MMAGRSSAKYQAEMTGLAETDQVVRDLAQRATDDAQHETNRDIAHAHARHLPLDDSRQVVTGPR